ncbi:protein of unknown function (Gcw_chp) [Sphingomonas gellani]|uniref:Porin n=1 Tax=Sphingomonas gellani TaxID=1166340 RepID=A0A1H8FWN2_9SPHN|nr:TorF family putative porin [Sphingomonas gellani]SEN35657.1 protein of unknown function (Gcw_chp) [Sphingomonas gellani]
MTTLFRIIATTTILLTATAAAQAQRLSSAGVEVTSDENRRGLSWSGGRAAVAADVAVDVGAWDATARLVTVRGAARHGGADAVADLTLGHGWDLGGFRLRASGTAHLFAGASGRLDFGELGADASYTLGPVQVMGGAVYAPRQRAIGGDNLYLFAGANAGIPATPFTVSAGIGHSSGSRIFDDGQSDGRADRLRPGGAYTDWRLGVEHNSGPLTLGLDYIGNDVRRGRDVGEPPIAAMGDAGNSGDRILARTRLSF